MKRSPALRNTYIAMLNAHVKNAVYNAILQRGDEHVKGSELASIFHVSDVQIREYVNALRRDKRPICADKTGYWISHKPEEVRAQIFSMEHRIKEMALAIAGLRRHLRDVRQESLFEATEGGSR